MNAYHLAFPAGVFDTVLSGFMGWYDCFDFEQRIFTQPDIKSREILRVLREGGKFMCCSWEEQEDLCWMEAAVLRHHPQLLEDDEYLARRPIGMAYEKAAGYELILRNAGFREVETSRLETTCLSANAQEWWEQMKQVGWKSLLEKIRGKSLEDYQRLKQSVLHDLIDNCQYEDGICFRKIVFFVRGIK